MQFMWRLSSPGRIVPGYPVPIHRMFQKLPQSLQRIDAAYERGTDSNLIFFSGVYLLLVNFYRENELFSNLERTCCC